MKNIHFSQKRNGTAASKVAATLLVATFFPSGAHSQEAAPSQTTDKPEVNITTVWESRETTDWGYDRNSSRSRVGMSGKAKLPGKTRTLKSTSTITQLVDMKHSQPKLFCESEIDLEYYQKDGETEVRTLFSSQNCDDYDAMYQLRISYFDASGELRRIRSEEKWPTGRTQQLSKTFQLEPGSKLKRVTSHIVSCTCTQPQ